jgi:hypothetical protein
VTSPSSPDIDRILEAIRAEARARGSKGRVGTYSTLPDSGGRIAGHGMTWLETKHVADFISMPVDVFIEAAYGHLLGRDPDPAGEAHYRRALLRGKLTRIEVLGRLKFSPEGRRRGQAVPGLVIAFLLATGYRVPIAGPLAGLAARLLCLPAHWQDRTTLEAAPLSR